MMAWFHTAMARIKGVTGKTLLAGELDDELHNHLEMLVEENIRQGLTAGEARRQALLTLGNRSEIHEAYRNQAGIGFLEVLWQDPRFGWRILRRSPGFTAVAVLSLTIGIGANTSIFSVLNAVLLRTLPVSRPEQLVMLTNPAAGGISVGVEGPARNLLSYPEFVQMRDHLTTISGMAASEANLNRWDLTIADGARLEQAQGKMISENYFSVLGVQPAIGRFFTAEDAKGPGQNPYAVISYNYWQSRFGGKTSVLGTPIRLHRANVTVIGVAGPGFHGETVGENPDLWVPLMMEPLVNPGRNWLQEDLSQSISKTMWLHAFARLNPGATRAQTQSEVDVQFHSILDAGYPPTLSPKERKEALHQHFLVRDARFR